ncbi:Sodium/hydrogen exchanger family-domain-containing protein [Irpex rosettiformis]|uniref:Sodium/hydrogen exchanger family-domain-containing protein n=1 Tax=Irpex rosettiformis TaxID=378272 RepID=A0ACB8UCD8_9APHY|nr:Sodium/hydrogen exchanger family-domain-containing protein [Irpex rosettiformis]
MPPASVANPLQPACPPTSNMGILTRDLYEVAGTLQRRAQAPEQAGVFSGLNPATYNKSDPLPLWVIQLVIIMAVTQLLALLFRPIRQPRVISEVIAGVILGPSIMGRIPGFSNSIFPVDSLPMITLTSTIGLVLFLFLVGLEIDVRIVKKNFKSASAISIAGLIVPLGLGAALGIPIYHQFVNPDINFGYFLLFTAVAIGITAFPVLCRILTELKLLEDPVGAITLAAGVGNDVVGWILLALTVALVNAGSGLTALWILLTAIGFVFFLLIPIKWAYRWLCCRTGSLENGTPTTTMMTITLVIVFISAFFTDIIGIHAIFGGFLAGLIIPHDNGYAIALVEKLEDLVSPLFIPLYFALTGLRTNLGSLDNGVTWGYTILICVVAFFSKFIACGLAAKACGFNWRESGAVGSLMSCKGLVELIVLNVGFSAGILDTRTFSMFVLHALVLTFITTPLTLLFYPERIRNRAAPTDTSAARSRDGEAIEENSRQTQELFRTRFSVVLEKIEQLPAVMTLTQLLQIPSDASPSTESRVSVDEKTSLPAVPPGLEYQLPRANAAPTHITLDALRLIELTNRTSAVLKSHFADSLIQRDSILAVIRTFGSLNRIAVSTALAIVGYDDFSSSVAEHVKRTSSQLVILPWSTNSPSLEDVSVAENSPSTTANSVNLSSVQAQTFRKVFLAAPSDVALFVDRGVSQDVNEQVGQHIFLPFVGGPDDRLALSFVVQLCMNPSTTATVTRFIKSDANDLTPTDSIEKTILHDTFSGLPDTVYALRDTQTRIASETADNIQWDNYSSRTVPELAAALSRITFSEESSPLPLHTILDACSRTLAEFPRSRPFVVLGRSRRMAIESHTAELGALLSETGATLGSDTTKTLGDLGAAFVAKNVNASLLVLQASSL